jgi:hypothetical protein
MRGIRAFLWCLVGAMTLQGYFHAAELGAAPTWMTATALQMTAWQERVMAATVGWWTGRAPWVGLPRSVVLSVLQETGRHPEGGARVTVPESVITARYLEQVQAEQLQWSLRHGDVVAATLYAPERPHGPGEEAIKALDAARCWRVQFNTAHCRAQEAAWEAAVEAQRLADLWTGILQIPAHVSVSTWLRETGREELANWVDRVYGLVRPLHNLTALTDERLLAVWAALRQGPVSEPLVTSLMEGEIWAQLHLFAMQRDSRMRMALLGAGYLDQWTVQEKLRNSTLRLVQKEEERALVESWFAEIAGRAWWVSEETPALMRRCLSVEVGDCMRIGPTEIEALAAQILERGRIREDWLRRIFLGMWSALPAMGLLFLLEIVVLGVQSRKTAAGPVESVIRLELPDYDRRRVERRTPRAVRRLTPPPRRLEDRR